MQSLTTHPALSSRSNRSEQTGARRKKRPSDTLKISCALPQLVSAAVRRSPYLSQPVGRVGRSQDVEDAEDGPETVKKGPHKHLDGQIQLNQFAGSSSKFR